MISLDMLDDKKFGIKPTFDEDYSSRVDYIELLCLRENSISYAEIVDLWNDSDLDNNYKRGTSDHLEEMDDLESEIEDYISYIKVRTLEYGDFYPFELDDSLGVIHKKTTITKEHILYFLLLMCSSTKLVDDPSMHFLTKQFEIVSKTIFRTLSPMGTVVEIFGTARDKGSLFCGSNLKERLSKLAIYIGSSLCSDELLKGTKVDKARGGDGGIDLVSVYKIDDAQFNPYAFAQCTCSRDKWISKQRDIDYSKWENFFTPFIHYPKYMFVPFSCHNLDLKFNTPVYISSFLIDRYRIIKLALTNADLKDELMDFCKKTVQFS